MDVLQEIFLATFISLFFAFLLAKFLSFVCDSENCSPKPGNAVKEPAAVGVFEDGVSGGGDQGMQCVPTSGAEQKVSLRYRYRRKETTDTVAEVSELRKRPDSGKMMVEDREPRSVHDQGGVDEREERRVCSDSGEVTTEDSGEGCAREIIGVREVRRDKDGATTELDRDHVLELRSLSLGGIPEEKSPIEHEEGSLKEVEVLEKTVDGDEGCAYLKEVSEARESLDILDAAEVQAAVDGGIEPEHAKKEEDQENCEKDPRGRYEGNHAIIINLETNSEPTERAEAQEANREKNQDERFDEDRMILGNSDSETRHENHETLDQKDQKEQSGDANEQVCGVIDEDEWEGIERSEVANLFTVAVCFIASPYGKEVYSELGNDVQMQLYGLQKVATEGPCYESQPSALKPATRAKWHAWQRLGRMNPEVAMDQYIAFLSENVPDWQAALSREGQEFNGSTSNETGTPSAETQDLSSSTGRQPNPLVQSTGEEIHTCNHGNVDLVHKSSRMGADLWNHLITQQGTPPHLQASLFPTLMVQTKIICYHGCQSIVCRHIMCMMYRLVRYK